MRAKTRIPPARARDAGSAHPTHDEETRRQPGHVVATGELAPEQNGDRSGHPHSFAEISVYPAQRVPEPLGQQFERVTGHSIGAMRIHTGPESERAAETLGARAFTIGTAIHFGAGEFQPGTPYGDLLLAHELTHAVQQRGAQPTPQMQVADREPGDRVEDEADEVADAVLEDDEQVEAPAITEHRAVIASQGKKKPTNPKSKPAAKPKPVSFNLFKTKFNATIDASNNVTVKKVGKSDGGWTFTAAGANKAKAERTLNKAEYVHTSGTSEPLVERCTVTVPARGPAAVSPIVAELGTPATLSIALSADKAAANTKAVTVNAVTLKQLDLPSAAIKFTPADGDSIHLALGGEAWVFSSIKPDVVPPATTATPVKGFFHIGSFTRYLDHKVPTFGIASPSVSDADRKQAMEDLTKAPTPTARRITGDEAAMFQTLSLIESDFAGVQTYDTGILSFGFAQWTVSGTLPRLLLKVDAATFKRYLGKYGLAVSAPVRQKDDFVAQFVASGRSKLGVRNPSEGALFLNSKELVTKQLLAKATAQILVMNGFSKAAAKEKSAIAAAKPDLKAADKARKAAAVKATDGATKKLDALRKLMAGLKGVKKVADPSAQADLLVKVANDGEAAAKSVVANCQSSEVMRGEEWALRFEMLGKSPGGQDAEIAEARAVWSEVSSKTTHGAAFSKLLPHLRGRSALLSSYINLPGSAARLGVVVDRFQAKKKSEAKAAAAAAAKTKTPVPASTGTEADWAAFPWPSADTRWTSLWTSSAIDELEAMAVEKLTEKPVTDPKRRRDIIKAQFP